MHPIVLAAAGVALIAAVVYLLIAAAKRGPSRAKGELIGTKKFFETLLRARPAVLAVTTVDWPTGNAPPDHVAIRYQLRFDSPEGAFRTWFDPGHRRSFPPRVEQGYNLLMKNVRWCRGCKDHGDGRHGRVGRPAQVAEGLDMDIETA